MIKTIRLPDDPSNAPLFGSSPYGLAWSPEGDRLAVAYGFGGDVGVWRTDGKLLTNFSLRQSRPSGPDQCLEFLRDGNTLLAPAPSDTDEAKKSSLALWNAETGQLERLIPGPFPDVPPPPNYFPNAPDECALSSDGHYVAMRPEQETRLYGFAIYDALSWDVIDFRSISGSDLPFRWPGESDVFLHAITYPSALAFGPGDVLSVGLVLEGILSLTPPYADAVPTFLRGTTDWGIQPVGPDIEALKVRNWNNDVSFNPIAYSPKGTFLAIGVNTFDAYYKQLKHDDEVERRKLAHLKIWDVRSQKVVAEDPDADYVDGMDWSPDGKLLATVTHSHTGYATHLDIYKPPDNDGRPILHMSIDDESRFVRFSPNGTELATTQGNAVQIYRLSTN